MNLKYEMNSIKCEGGSISANEKEGAVRVVTIQGKGQIKLNVVYK